MNIPKLIDQLILHEGIKLFPYKDTQGLWTIGVGRNLIHNPLSRNEKLHIFSDGTISDQEVIESFQRGGLDRSQALYLLENDIRDAQRYCERLSANFEALSDPRQHVLIDMCFNLGYGTMRRGFLHIVDLIDGGDYRGAVEAIQKTRYARQVGHRDNRLCVMLLNDVFHDQVTQRQILEIENGAY